MTNPFYGAYLSSVSFARRATRTEYLISIILYQILLLVAFIILALILGLISTSLVDGLTFVYIVTSALLNIVATKNRLNDCDWSGWWMLIPFVSLVFIFVPGTIGANRWGVRL
jgi:uncharacterized membrane protein YhaH (DUF805 family)